MSNSITPSMFYRTRAMSNNHKSYPEIFANMKEKVPAGKNECMVCASYLIDSFFSSFEICCSTLNAFSSDESEFWHTVEKLFDKTLGPAGTVHRKKLHIFYL